MKKFTYKQVKEIIEANGCKLNSLEYKCCSYPLSIKCICGEDFDCSFEIFKKTKIKRCPTCSPLTKWTYDSVKAFIEVESGSNCKLKNLVYKNTKTKLDIECACGEVFQTPLETFKTIKQYQCGKCSGTYRRTDAEFKKEIQDMTNGEYTVTGEYKDTRTKVKITHNICGWEHNIAPSDFLAGKRCPKCQGKLRKDTEYFKKEVFELVGDEYEVLGEYTNTHNKILMRHNKCGHEYNVAPKEFLQGNRCPKCANYKGEISIQDYFDAKLIPYEFQRKFDGLVGVGNGLLSYDFYLPQYNLLIEYQGSFHDGSAGLQTEIVFIKQQEHDRRKKEYARLHNIKLLEIWYYDFKNIKSILSKQLNISTIQEAI